MNLEAFPADPGLPQLKDASDPELMRDLFRGHLSPLPGRVYHIQDCLLSWVRYLRGDRKSTRLNSSHVAISYAVFCLKKKNAARHDALQHPQKANKSGLRYTAI